MKHTITLAIAALALASARAEIIDPATTHWEMAKVFKVDVLESFPVQYDVSYEARCNDLGQTVVKFVAGEETVIGVAVRRGPEEACDPTRPLAERAKIRLAGEAKDPAQVRTLK